MATNTTDKGIRIRGGSGADIKFDVLQDDQQQPLIRFWKADGTVLFQVDGSGNMNGVKTYRALLTQLTTAAPTEAAVLTNGIGTIVYTRSNTGIYVGTLAGAFPVGKTFVLIGSVAGGANAGLATVIATDANTFTIETADTTFASADSLLSSTPIQVLVYP